MGQRRDRLQREVGASNAYSQTPRATQRPSAGFDVENLEMWGARESCLVILPETADDSDAAPGAATRFAGPCTCRHLSAHHGDEGCLYPGCECEAHYE